MFREKRVIPIPVDTNNPKVLLLIDWENIFFSLFSKLGPDRVNLNERFRNLVEWTNNEIGELFGKSGFLFAPPHFSAYHQDICVRNQLKIMICPKRKIILSQKSDLEDTVDETIVWFAIMMIKHPDIKFLCLASGDNDYVPMLEEVKRLGVKIALIPPTINSLSKSKKLVKLVDINPRTNKKMILILDQL